MRLRLIPVAVVVVVAAAVVGVGVGLATGQGGGGGIPHGTPPPPTGDIGALPAEAQTTPSLQNQPPILINGVNIPIPDGAQLGITVSGPGGVWTIERGKSLIVFGAKGATSTDVRPEDAAAFAPTIHALDVLAARRPEP